MKNELIQTKSQLKTLIKEHENMKSNMFEIQNQFENFIIFVFKLSSNEPLHLLPTPEIILQNMINNMNVIDFHQYQLHVESVKPSLSLKQQNTKGSTID